MKARYLILILAIGIVACAKVAPEPEFNPNIATQRVITYEKLDFIYAAPAEFSHATTVSYCLKVAGHVKVSVCDPDRGEIQLIEDSWKEKGKHQLDFFGGFLAEGKYILCLKVGTEEMTYAIYRMD